MKVFVDGMGSGEVVDLALDQHTGEIGYAVKLDGGGLVAVESSMVRGVNPSSVSFPAVGEVELETGGYPNVFALRGEKISKKSQLSDLLGYPIEWEAKNGVGFYIPDPAGNVILGYSFRDALLTARDQYDLGKWSNSDIERLTKESDLKKWGVLRSSNPTMGGEFRDLNPWGITREGKKAFYVRKAGPSASTQLSMFSDIPIVYHFPGDPTSPDPSRGGFYDEKTGEFIARSASEAQTRLFGVPVEQIERAVIRGALGFMGRKGLAGGGNVLTRVQSSPDFSAFLGSLSPSDADRLEQDSYSLGYDAGLSDLYADLKNLLSLWGREVNGSLDPRFVNPPQYLEVIAPTQSFGMSLETSTGDVFASDYKTISGTVIGPSMGYQSEIMEDMKARGKRDFSTPDQAWIDFYNLNSQVAQNQGIEARVLDVQDSVQFEGVKERYGMRSPVKTLEQAFKAVVSRDKIKRWDDFPMKQFQEWVGVDWLVLPESSKRLESFSFPELSDQALDVELLRVQREERTRFVNLKGAVDILSYYADRIGSIDQLDSLRSMLEGYLGSDRPFTDSEFSEFRDLLLAAVGGEIAQEEGIPF